MNRYTIYLLLFDILKKGIKWLCMSYILHKNFLGIKKYI